MKWNLVFYTVIPIVLLVKYLYYSFCLEVGCVVKEYKIQFKKLFHIVLLADIALVFQQFVKILFIRFNRGTGIDYFTYYTPLSILNLFEISKINSYMLPILQNLNLFQLLYIGFLSLGISHLANQSFNKSLLFVLIFYGAGVLTWLLVYLYLVIALT